MIKHSLVYCKHNSNFRWFNINQKWYPVYTIIWTKYVWYELNWERSGNYGYLQHLPQPQSPIHMFSTNKPYLWTEIEPKRIYIDWFYRNFNVTRIPKRINSLNSWLNLFIYPACIAIVLRFIFIFSIWCFVSIRGNGVWGRAPYYSSWYFS